MGTRQRQSMDTIRNKIMVLNIYTGTKVVIKMDKQKQDTMDNRQEVEDRLQIAGG